MGFPLERSKSSCVAVSLHPCKAVVTEPWWMDIFPVRYYVDAKGLKQSLHMIAAGMGNSVFVCGISTYSAVLKELFGVAFHHQYHCFVLVFLKK